MDILIVDDDRNTRYFLKKGLEEKEYNCITASSGEEAIRQYRDNNLDCVLLDVNLPDKGGIEVAQEIFDINEDASIVMITGFDERRLMRKAMRTGIYDYLIKPIELEEVVRVLNKVEERNLFRDLKNKYHGKLEETIKEQRSKLKSMMFATIKSFVRVLEARDVYQMGHSKDVMEFSDIIAEDLSVSEDEREVLSNAALIHDIGKIGVPDSILLKPGPLTDDEYSIIKRHPEMGREIISPCIEDNRILEAILYHHERYDGEGFPEGISGKEIPIFARIIAVADSISAMLSARPYRASLGKEFTINELIDNSGTQFDPEISDIAVNVLKEDKIEK